jgi:fructosamine-3-kinase
VTFPPALQNAIAERWGSPYDVQIISRNAATAAARCTTGGERVVVKWLMGSYEGGLDPVTVEARGLRLIEQTRSLRVPRVLAAETADRNRPAFVVIEWIESAPKPDRDRDGELLGGGLAALHRNSAPAFGLDHDNYCGPTLQINGWRPSWIAFYRECRLQPQIELAQRAGLLPKTRSERLERLLDQLDQWIPDDREPPSLIHGDLWGGNWLIDGAALPVLIDPAVSYSHREAELAMCHVFGGFSPSFFAAYDEAAPPAAGRDERLPLYQLYHLLNHLNLFGQSYGAAVDDVLRRYVG